MIGVDFGAIDSNRNPDFNAAKSAGVGFCIRKAFQAPYGEDAGFVEDWKKMLAADVVRGAYVFPDVRAAALPASQQVALFFDVVTKAGGMRPGDLPPAMDVEFPGGKLPRAIPEIVAVLEEFATAMRDAFGMWPLLYTSARVWDGTDTDALRGPASWLPQRCPLWVKTGYVHHAGAHISVTSPTGRPRLPNAWVSLPSPGAWVHQWDGDQRGLAGFTSTVDVNRALILSADSNYLDAQRVSWVQRMLSLEVTGRWDATLDAAVRALQASAGLDTDGVIGVRTFAHLAALNS